MWRRQESDTFHDRMFSWCSATQALKESPKKKGIAKDIILDPHEFEPYVNTSYWNAHDRLIVLNFTICFTIDSEMS